MNPDDGSMSLCPDSFEPLDLPVVRDVPGSGTAYGDAGIRSSPPRPWRRPTVRTRPIRTHEPKRRPRAPDPDVPQGSSRPVRDVGNRVTVKPLSSRLRRGKSGRWRPSCPIQSLNGGPAKLGLPSADGCMRCPSATTGQRQGPPSLVAAKPAPFWAELSETTRSAAWRSTWRTRASAGSSRRRCSASSMAAAPPADDELEWERRRTRRPSGDTRRARRRPARHVTRERRACTD
jgi:hypothetical protein